MLDGIVAPSWPRGNAAAADGARVDVRARAVLPDAVDEFPPNWPDKDPKTQGAIQACEAAFLDTLQISDDLHASVGNDKSCRRAPWDATCGRWMQLGCQGCGSERWVYKSCGDRLGCPSCRKAWAADTRRRFAPVLAAFERQRYVRFITLTVKNGPDLAERVEHLRASMRKLSQRKLWKRAVRMGVRVLEVTYGRDGWHAHFHILAAGTFLPFDELQGAWREITGDSYVVNVKQADPLSVPWELFKYTVKDVDLPRGCMEEARRVLKGQRIVELIGANVKVRRFLRSQVVPRERVKCECCGGDRWFDYGASFEYWTREGGPGPASPPPVSVVRVVQGLLFETGRLWS